MASPFYLFRKHQKTFLVIAGVLAMFIFVLADPLMSWLQSNSGGGGPRSANTKVATWDGGSMTVQQLNILSQRRYKISEFMQRLVGMAAGLVEQEGGTPVPPALPDFRLPNNDSRSVQIGVVTTRVLAELAEQSGITLSDEVVNYYLREWGLRKLGDSEIRAILKSVNLSDKQLFAGLREMLMRNFYFNSYLLATRGIMPEQRWQDWKRINERISVEAAILPANKFVSEVPEPTEAELVAFYEQYKDREDGMLDFVMGAQLPSPEPGFREPRRVKLKYLVGNIAEWTQNTLDQVSDEEIADYYERNKRTMFVKESGGTSAAGLFDDEEPTTTPPSGESASADGDSKPEAEPKPETEETKTEDAEAAPSAEEAPAEEKSPTEETPAEETPAEETPTEETTVEENDAKESPAEEESSSTQPQNPFRLAALQVEAEVEVETESAETDDGDKDVEVKVEEAESEDSAGPGEEPVDYVPLSEVRDQIRRTLANDKAVVELQKVVDRTFSSLQSAYNPYGFEVVTARSEGREVPKPPAKLSDYVAIAKETGLTSEETALLSGLELADTYVGKAFDAQSRSEFVVQAMFRDQELYEPYRAIDLDGNWYIVSKVEDVASRVPEFEEVRESVLAAWKDQEAAKLALAKAKELAEEAKASGASVTETARGLGYEIVTTDMFSWLTFGSTPAEMQRGPKLGEAPPLEAVGPEFMTEAFQLKPEDRVALLNHDHSNALFVQLAEREQTMEEMRKQFLAEANTWFGGQVMNQARWGTAHRQLLSQLSDDVDLNLDKLQEFMARDSN